MKLNNVIKRTLWAVVLPLAALLTSCNDENYLIYDISQSGVYFTKDTLNYSFGVTSVEIKTYTYKIPVQIMGGLSSVKRPIGYTIDADSTTAEEGVHFSIGEACVLPDSTVGYIPVIIYRESLEGTDATGYTMYKLCLRLAQNDYFTPTLDSLHQVRVFSFDNSVSQPEWYDEHGKKVWQEKYLGKWHPYKFIKMVEYFHAVKDVLPETYKDMVKLYGENLEHIDCGDPYQYRLIFIKHIYTPMYEYFNDPARRDEILAKFSDFPFDFPDPLAANEKK